MKGVLAYSALECVSCFGKLFFCELPFIEAHIVKNPYGRVDWVPFILLNDLTVVYYIWVSVRYSRSGMAVVDQPLCFAVAIWVFRTSTR